MAHIGVVLHLMKLAVGIRDRAHLAAVQTRRGLADPPLRHLTRSHPRRAAEILAGGSIYWVIGGLLSVRQRILAITAAAREDGTPGTALHLDPTLVAVVPRPVKAFQGWRYLAPAEAPADVGVLGDAPGALPEDLERVLRELCLL